MLKNHDAICCELQVIRSGVVVAAPESIDISLVLMLIGDVNKSI